ncbi:MAG: hypothetical protein AAGE80_13185 [Pseudomonadota bacterium]
MTCIEISPQITQRNECIRYDFLLSYPDNRDAVHVFYEVFGHSVDQPDHFDGILYALVFHAMGEGLDLKLAGSATVEALLNLKEFQLAWSRWLPSRYRPINIEASHLVERSPAASNEAISAFSGGVDATFTLFNHAPSTSGLHRKLSACMVVQGFDIALGNQRDFDSVLQNAKRLHASQHLETFWVRTNIKELELQDWENSFAAQLASCLHLFSQRFSTGLLGSSEPYHALVIPWGSNPITDHLLSGSAMKIVHDGAGFSRTEKVDLLSRRSGATDTLRVCWEGAKQDRNCGKCEKCIRTKMNLLASGIENPVCFDEPLDPADIDKIHIGNAAILAELQSILSFAEDNEISGLWVEHLRRRVRSGIDGSSKGQVKDLRPGLVARLGEI